MIKEKVEETVFGPAVVRAKLVSFRWSSQVDVELASRSASPPCCLAVHVPRECLTMKLKTAIAGRGELPTLAQVSAAPATPKKKYRDTQARKGRI